MKDKVILGHLSTENGCRPNCPACAAELFECANCGQRWQEDQLKEVQDYFQRVNPGETVPAGECPDCGCLCYPRPPKPKRRGPELVTVAKRLLSDLKKIGFGSNDDVNGADLVDVMASYIPSLSKAIKSKSHVLVEVNGGVAEVSRKPANVTVTILDHDNERHQ